LRHLVNSRAGFWNNERISTAQCVHVVSRNLSHFVVGLQFDAGQRITEISVGVGGCMSQNLALHASWELLYFTISHGNDDRGEQVKALALI
jgi:hypothetical protein